MFTNNLALGQGTDEGHIKHKMGKTSPTGDGTGLLHISSYLPAFGTALNSSSTRTLAPNIYFIWCQ